jgi:hypothetical protein
VLRRIEIIGEAVKNLPAELKQRYPDRLRGDGRLAEMTEEAYHQVMEEISVAT